MIGTRRKEEPGVRPQLPWIPKKAFALGAAVLSVSILAACSSSGSSSSSTSASTSASSSPATTSAPITIGASLSLTGDNSADGIAFDRG
jgi:hypothetical protein